MSYLHKMATPVTGDAAATHIALDHLAVVVQRTPLRLDILLGDCMWIWTAGKAATLVADAPGAFAQFVSGAQSYDWATQTHADIGYAVHVAVRRVIAIAPGDGRYKLDAQGRPLDGAGNVATPIDRAVVLPTTRIYIHGGEDIEVRGAPAQVGRVIDAALAPPPQPSNVPQP